MPQGSHQPQILFHECCLFIKQAIMRLCHIRTVWHMYVCLSQHCPPQFCDRLRGSQTCLAQTFGKSNRSSILHTLVSPISSQSDNCFTIMRLFAIIMFLILSTLTSVHVGYGLPLRGKSCSPLPDVLCAQLLNLLRSAASSPYTFCNRLWTFPHTTFSYSALFLTDVIDNSHV
jgi:hypothetical protein